MLATQDLALKTFFSRTIVLGKQYLPLNGPLVLAPTHRSRWDALMLTMAAGRRVSNRDCRFMVTLSEMKGLQGWFLNRLGCYPVDQLRPSLISLRYSVDLMMAGEQLVVFPEGRINRTGEPLKLEQGLVRLSQLASKRGVDVQVLPIGLAYSEVIPKPFGTAAISFQEPIGISKLGKEAAHEFNVTLSQRMHAAEQAALRIVGRI
ncbi:Phospholipid and glycerol acyltransferase [Prochlorococcus sp. MIT 0601]|nr:Phospholipid and glycerol acyltransferase [Prochlorococcus sp. MIT 0601]